MAGLAKSSQRLLDISLVGKTVIITGSNTGLGLDAARQCLILKASRVVLAVRTLSKGEEAAYYLKSHQTVKDANPAAEIKVMHLDLDDYASVKDFSVKARKDLDALDVLILNAGLNMMEFQTSPSGHERVMQVNFYSNAMLALELLPLLEATAAKRGAPSRLTWVGSRSHKAHTMGSLAENESIIAHFDDKNLYRSFMRYPDSKFLALAFVEELAQRVPAEKVTINIMCPGLVATDVDKYSPWWVKLIAKPVRALVARSLAEGSGYVLNAAFGAGPESHGRFIADHNIASNPALLATPQGAALKENLWKEIIEDAKKADPSLPVP
ncbi:MAG: hypothetical protein MMC33_009404 [Icmadophila ericetorum]|nr:hypothetical protein [Icmadophila ericetorum]